MSSLHTGTETIAAIATAPGLGALAVVRLSGPKSLEVAGRIVRCGGTLFQERAGGTFVHGTVVGRDGHGGTEAVVDEVVALIYRGPNSYTGEDSVELICHGGSVSASRVLRAMLDAGAEMAEPGEFTKRAFLNGRMDLVQAEAVCDLIHAHSERAAQAAVLQLRGRLSHEIDTLYKGLVSTVADLEASLDFSEDDELDVGILSRDIAQLHEIASSLDALGGSWNQGRLLRDGVSVVITGRPNAGKSTLFNCLLGSNRAIVHPLPGTTRDVIDDYIVVDGYPIHLFDTAGLREANCEVEREGIRRAEDVADDAHIILYVVDSNCITKYDADRIQGLIPRHMVVIANKMDTVSHLDPGQIPPGIPYIECALNKSIGLDRVIAEIKKMLPRESGFSEHAFVTSERQRDMLLESSWLLRAGILDLETNGYAAAATASSQIREALDKLGQITGRIYYNDMLDTIFSRFCIGK